MATITGINLDFNDIKAAGEVRKFTVSGTNSAVFSLEITNEDTTPKKYYNFKTNLFQTTPTKLKNISISGGGYTGNITFPKVTDADQYNLILFAERIYNTRHSKYNEIRFADNSIDINSSTGSNSNVVQKVIYQTLDVDIVISGHSPNSTITHQGSVDTQTITTSRGKSRAKIPFSIPWTVTNTRTLTIDRQPKTSDIATYVTRIVSLNPVDIPGEDVSLAGDGTGPGVRTGVVSGGGGDGSTTTTTLTATAGDSAAVGDRITGNDFLNARNITVATLPGGNDLTSDVVFVAADGLTLNFTKQKNYKWSLDNIYGLKPGMRVYATSTTGTANGFTNYATIKNYLTQITVFEGERNEYTIDDVNLSGMATYSIKPTFLRNASTNVLATTQTGDVIFSQQARNAFGLQNINIYGYGRSEINSLTEYDIEFSDLRVTLSGVTTTTAAAVSANTTVEVDSGVGISENISTVSGIGINPAVIAPTVTTITAGLGTGTWSSGAARLILSAAQTLEDNMSLTFDGASTVATITGNIKVNKVGNADVAIYFDLEKFLTMQAAP